MIGVGTFELFVGLLVAVPLVYFVFRKIVSTLVLALLLVVLSPILAVLIGWEVAWVWYGLFGG